MESEVPARGRDEDFAFFMVNTRIVHPSLSEDYLKSFMNLLALKLFYF